MSNVAADTTVPVVTITSPANQATASGLVTVTASATDNVGVVGVRFQVDGTAVGEEAMTSPYSIAWDTTTVADGPHTVTATARDASGNDSASSVVVNVLNVVPDTLPPSVAITSPADQSPAGGSVTITAGATDDTGVVGVQFQVDRVALGAEKLSAPYTATWNSTSVVNGLHTLTAIARDAAGNRSQASVTVDVLNVVAPPPPTPPPGPVAAYNFDEGSGTRVLDASGAGNIGTILRANWSAAGHTGSARSFGNSAWVTIADAASLDLRNGMTLEAWVRPTSSVSTRTVIYKQRSTGFWYALFSSNSSSDPVVSVRASATFSANDTTTVPTNVWTHLAATYDGSRLRLFVNGLEVDNTLVGSPITTSSGVLRIGGNSNSVDYFRGLIDDVRIYSRALSATEIQSDMDTPVR